MRKMLVFLCIAGVFNSYAQTSSLVTVSVATPKLGQKGAFESAWIAHLKKFHQADTTNRRGVYEITSGIRSGSFYLTHNGMAWADLDNDRPTQKAHDMDFSSTVVPTMESQSGVNIYRWADSLSYRPEVQATKFLFTIYHIKTGHQNDVTDETKRAIAVNKKINSPVSYSGFLLTLAGSKPELVIIRNLKDGFKEIDADYYKGLNDQFKAAYIEMFGYPLWEKRQTMQADLMDLVEQEMTKYRAALAQCDKLFFTSCL